MSFNPTRLTGNRNNRVSRIPPPGSGTKRSDIRNRNIGVSEVAFSTVPKQTNLGLEGIVLDNSSFTIKYLNFTAGSSIGYGVNQKGDRFIQVIRGTLYMFVDTNGAKTDKVINQGGFFSAPKGLAHGFATSALSNVELLITETKNYDKTWKVIEPGLNTTVAPPMFETRAVREARETALKGVELPPKKRGRPSKVKEAVLQQAEERKQHKKGGVERTQAKASYSNPNSTSSTGYVRPLGPAAFNDD